MSRVARTWAPRRDGLLSSGIRARRSIPLLFVAALVTGLTGCSPVLYVLYRGFRGDPTRGSLTLGLSVTGDTTSSPDEHTLGCGAPDDAGDDEWSFTAPESGQYRFTVQGAYDSVLAVLDGESEMACNDDTGSTSVSQVTVTLVAGEEYTVVVDGYRSNRGRYTLTVDRGTSTIPGVPGTPGVGATSPVTEDPQMVVRRCVQAQRIQAGTIRGTMDPMVATMRTSCGANGPGGDVLYLLPVTQPSFARISLTSSFDGVLELRTACQSPQVVACNDDFGDTRHSRIEGQLQPGEYLLIVDSYAVGATGPFDLAVELAPLPPPGSPPREPTVTPAPGIEQGGTPSTGPL